MQAIKVLAGADDPTAEQSLSYEGRLALRKLAEERASGRFKDDVTGFV